MFPESIVLADWNKEDSLSTALGSAFVPSNRFSCIYVESTAPNVHFPLRQFIRVLPGSEQGKVLGMLAQHNFELQNEDNECAFQDEELFLLNDLVKAVVSGEQVACHSTTVATMINKMMLWPRDRIYPCFYVIRLLLLLPPVAKHYASIYDNQTKKTLPTFLEDMIVIAWHETDDSQLRQCTLQCLTNMFNSPRLFPILIEHHLQIFELITQMRTSNPPRKEVEMAAELMSK